MASIFSGLTVIADLLNSFAAVDVVGIFDDSLQQVFADARPLKAEVKETSMVMNHPTETGVNLSDHHIINQVEINIPMLIKSDAYNSAYAQIRKSWVAADKFSVQTRTGVYSNMIIADMPHQEEPDIYDAITILLRFKEVIYIVPNSVSGQAQPSNFTPVEPSNTNTFQIGQKFPVITSLAGAVLTRLAIRR